MRRKLRAPEGAGTLTYSFHFQISNNGGRQACSVEVLAPTFQDANDRIALNTLAKLFRDREVIGIHCTELVWGLGALHCMTQQQPNPRRSARV